MGRHAVEIGFIADLASVSVVSVGELAAGNSASRYDPVVRILNIENAALVPGACAARCPLGSTP